MGLGKFTLLWNKKKSNEPKTINIFLGFFFIINFCLGTGFLGVPYSFYYSGYLAAIPTLLIISFVSWINATYLLECMARAQAIETHKKATEGVSGGSESDTDDKGEEMTRALFSDKAIHHPNFVITVHRKFEQVELCEMFFNKWVKYLYLITLTVYTLLATWSFSTVGGSAWAINIPFNFSTVQECRDDDFHHEVLPPEVPCRNAYYVCLTIFGVIVITLSLLDLKEQAVVQMFLGFLRFLTVGAIIIYCIVRIIEAENKCDVDIAHYGNSTPSVGNITQPPSLKSFLVKFDFWSWTSAIPVFTYAFIIHQGIPSLTHPVKQKKHLRWLVVAMFSTAGICYFSLGIVVPIWFRADIQETCTLNWGELTQPSNSLQLRLLSYYIVLFPSLDVLSAFPLCVHTVVNNVYIIITGHDTSTSHMRKNHDMSRKMRFIYKYDILLRLGLRFIAALIPLLLALGVANLIYVLKYAGLIGFAICFGFPSALQLRSIYVCKKRFRSTLVDVAGGHTQETVGPSETKNDVSGHMSQEKAPLLSVQELQGKDERSLYMTPYSSRIFSHPIAVVVVMVIGFSLFLMTLVSLGAEHFITKQSCLPESDRFYDEL